MTAKQLREAEARYQRACRVAERERLHRHVTIHTALSEGWTHTQIAEATGLTRARIGQIAAT